MIKYLFVFILLTNSLISYGVTVQPLNLTPVKQERIGKPGLYKFDLSDISLEGKYALSINGKNYPFSFPEALTDAHSMPLFLPVVETGDDHQYNISVYGINIRSGIIPVITKRRTVSTKNHYQITKLHLSRINDSQQAGAKEIFTDYLLQLQIRINHNDYWIDPRDKDFGWLYQQVFYNFHKNSNQRLLITNLVCSPAIVIDYADETSGRVIRIYNKVEENFKLQAFIETHVGYRNKSKFIESNIV
ncbi:MULTISPECIES: hypothetical protein [Cysteiniphilum]|uniref:Uncharacterized protein n=1 Tax=Cysteiniphilum litorale TaxID=2056700 RepID=A0A8J2Z287_9GAMM|nr:MULTISPECIES: hypothetical protein [Cysteiniphilum]GGF88884.1 hypothetical protein GCM10010995_02680 [Cysteiniphilum litorale]